MKFEILEQKDNRLLNRKDFIVKITDVYALKTRCFKKFCSKTRYG